MRNSAEPMLTRAMVCKPAILDRHWRSNPIARPSTVASPTRVNSSTASMLRIFHPAAGADRQTRTLERGSSARGRMLPTTTDELPCVNLATQHAGEASPDSRTAEGEAGGQRSFEGEVGQRPVRLEMQDPPTHRHDRNAGAHQQRDGAGTDDRA